MVKDNIVNNKNSIYNPIVFIGLDRYKRYTLFWSIFNKEFNKEYKNSYRYLCCNEEFLKEISDDIKVNIFFDVKLVIIEKLDFIEGDISSEFKLFNFIVKCIEEDKQVIICLNKNISDNHFSINFRQKLENGFVVYLNN